MPNTKSAKKRHKQSEAQRLRNRAVRSTLKKQVRKVREAIAKPDAEKGAEEFRLATKKLDQAASKNVIAKNTASRLKSRLSAALKKISPPKKK